MKQFYINEKVWIPGLQNDGWDYIPKQVTVLFGPDTKEMWCVVKENGAFDIAHESIMFLNESCCDEYIKIEKYND